MDQELELSTWISNMRRVSGVRHFSIRRAADGELLARGNARIGYIDLSTGRPAQMPEAWAADFKADIVD
jgi:acyl-CoA thioesterase FadM